MSHQTGIQANDELKSYFAKCRDGQIRLLKVVIENEQLTLGCCMKQTSSWEKDYDALILPQIEEKQACYILFRFDSCNVTGYNWLLISWVPDSAAVRHKMLYASTKATLKTEFGSSLIAEEVHCTVMSEISYDGYTRHSHSKSHVPAPLTTREEELQEMKKVHNHTNISVDSKQQTLGGVLFPIAPQVKQSIDELLAGTVNYIQMKIDIDGEKVLLELAQEMETMERLASKIPMDHARYHLYKFKHTHEGDYMESIIFIYTMPGYNCSIKERMLYSSCKLPLTDSLASWGVDIAKKLEVDDISELTDKFLYDELHPIKNLHQPKFAKPKGPPNRGPRRITRPTD